MRVRFFGTRGSIATPGPDTLRYGGNTSCIEVQSSAGALVILDMGTGATVLGRELMARGEPSRGHAVSRGVNRTDAVLRRSGPAPARPLNPAAL